MSVLADLSQGGAGSAGGADVVRALTWLAQSVANGKKGAPAKAAFMREFRRELGVDEGDDGA